MTREEVIRGLEICANGWDCSECPYDEIDGCYEIIKRDALALLREQEPVAPELQSGGNYVCGACGVYTVGFMHPLTGESIKTWGYCARCGKAVKWE